MEGVALHIKATNGGCQQKERRKAPPPLISLHSFVLGFLIGCVVICLAGFHYRDECTDRTCIAQNRARPQMSELDVPFPQDQDSTSKLTLEQASQDPEFMETEKILRNVTTQADNDPAPKCENKLLRVIILVLTSPPGSMRRNAIRGSWMHDHKDKNLKVTYKFLVGTLGLKESQIHSLTMESKQFGDLLLFDDLKDTYRNLSRKILKGFNWVEQELKNFDFLIKTDDDSYVQIGKVAVAFREMDCPDTLYWGYFNGHAFPEMNGKWQERKWHNCPHYLPYAMGGGYVLSQRVVKILTSISDRLMIYSNEDVTVGSWLAPFNLIRYHDMRFNVESMSHGCNNKYLITHKDTTRSLYEKFKNLHANGTLCSPEKEIRPAYNYNWSVPPLDCCDRIKDLDIMYSVYNG